MGEFADELIEVFFGTELLPGGEFIVVRSDLIDEVK